MLSACIQENKTYYGNTLTKFAPNKFLQTNNYGKPDDAVGCQKICQDTPHCHWFNWYNDTGCFLFSKRSDEFKEWKDPKDKDKVVATGPAFCLGK